MADQTPAFLAQPEPITEFIETREYDVVVVGAGAAGVACALSAFENGASVAVLQKESVAMSQGNYAGGHHLDTKCTNENSDGEICISGKVKTDKNSGKCLEHHTGIIIEG